MATIDNIQANVGPLLCFFFHNNSSPVDVYLFVLSHLHEHDIHFALVFLEGRGGGVNPYLSTVFQI